MPDLHRIAVVNRGESAMRGLRGIADHNRRHGTAITSIALPTDADAGSWFARVADEVVSLGPAFHTTPDGTRRLAYLDHDLVMEALTRARADAVWVGWGFVAEDADFAQRCEEAGITFIGPSADVIRRLGDKVAAKRLAESVDVPVAPWSGGPVTSAEEAMAAAEEIGYPLMVKAAAGGGGRGIRKVAEPRDLGSAVESARAEARLAFRDDRVFLEQALNAARHIEVQVIADQHGTTWAVGVRDCSVQRRNQKVIEETASAALLDPAIEQGLRDAAVRLCAQAGYSGAGTVEFLHDPATGQSAFMEVNTRLQVEHPVTELVTGVDLVDLQLRVARGLPLEGDPPPTVGHAIEVRLNAEDPLRDFAPSPGEIALLRVPGGPGVRVDAGVSEGDTIASEFDSMIAKVLTVGSDRTEALARMERALREAAVVVRGGTTNKAFLLTLLKNPDIVEGGVTTRWLDQLTATGGHLPEHDHMGVVVAAVEIADLELAAQRTAFLSTAQRGRPQVDPGAGVEVAVRCRGQQHEMTVFRTGPDTYRIAHPGGLLDISVERLGAFERRVHVGGRSHKILAYAEGPTVLVEVDGMPHRVERDDGGSVRSPAPAAVIRHLADVGDEVAAGDPLVVIESMKMETTVAAPFSGRVRELVAALNTQVDAGAPLVVLEPVDDDRPQEADSEPVTLPVTKPVGGDPESRCEWLFEALRSWLMGYDLDPGHVTSLAAERAFVCDGLPDGHAGLAAHEEEVLEVFADLGALSRPNPLVEDVGELVTASPKEHLATYLQAIDRGSEVVPDTFLTRLQQALAHYGVTSLDRSAGLEAALHWMYRGFLRLDDVAPVVAGILQRRLDAVGAMSATPELRDLLDRLAQAAEGRHPAVGDLARSLRFRLFDEPLVEAARGELYAEMDQVLDDLAADPDRADRSQLIRRLVTCPQPMRAHLLERYGTGDPVQQRIALEVRARRYYRIRELEDVEYIEVDGHLVAAARYAHEGRWVHLVIAYTDEERLDGLLRLVADHTAAIPDEDWSVIDVMVTRTGPVPAVEDLAAEMGERLDAITFDTRVHRFDTTATYAGNGPGAGRTLHVTHRQRPNGGWAEETVYRNLHPMLAKRVGVWRLGNFHIRRMPSVEDVYVFHGVARDNPADERLFAIAEVRDLTPTVEEDGRVTGLPQLERMLVQALSTIRLQQSQRLPGERLLHNRVVLYVRPPLTVPEELWRDIAHRMAPATIGLGVEKVVLVVRIPDPATDQPQPAVLHMHHVSRQGVVIRRDEPDDRPIRTLSDYELRVLKTERRGSAYPYEIMRLLTPPDDAESDFPPGEFTEMDLDDDGRLVEVDRPWGGNTANVVVGVVSNRTAKVPEGMRRAVVLGDPSRSLGSLAEAECRRIMGAIDLAEREGIPVEWYAVSSGARISMESGTENMDWIGAVLRRLIEFTQAGGEVNIVVTGINVGAQPYWNAEATMLMHTRGILVMTPASAMVLTGKQALDFSGGVSAEDNFGIGGFQRIMGPNGQGQYWAPSLEEACALLLRHYDHTYVVPGERFPRPAISSDPADRDVSDHPHAATTGSPFTTVGEIFGADTNAERKLPFDIRSVMAAVSDRDHQPLERWGAWVNAENAVVWDAHVGGAPVCMIGIESHSVARRRVAPADGPPAWTSGTLFPQSSRKIARALNAASGNRPAVVLANLSGFDGSPESMRRWQLEYGAEIGRAVTNFDGPIVFVVVSRYHGGAFVVFSKQLNPSLEIAAVEGSYASVIGGTPAAAVVFAREVAARTKADQRLAKLRDAVAAADGAERVRLQADLESAQREIHAEKIGEVAEEFDGVHDIARAQRVGSVDHIIPAARLRPYIIEAVARGMGAIEAAS